MSINATKWIWKDGDLVPWEEATAHVMSHALHYGSSVFEGIRVYASSQGPAFFRLDCHVRRFFDSAKINRIPLPVSREEMSAACRLVVAENELESAYVRPLAYRGYGALGLDPTDSPVEMIILAVPWGRYLGESGIEEGVDVCVTSWARIAPNTLPVMSKAGGNYVSSTFIHMEAKRNGYAEGIALGPDGLVSEGAGENLFLVRDGVLMTPALNGTLLSGITRDAVISLARDLGHEVREGPVPREMLYVADEVFLTGTAAEITPVRSIDRDSIGDGKRGPVTEAIQQAFFGLFSGVTEDRWGWLSGLGDPA